MGVVVNAVKDMGNTLSEAGGGLGQGVAPGAYATAGKVGALDKLGGNAASCLE